MVQKLYPKNCLKGLHSYYIDYDMIHLGSDLGKASPGGGERAVPDAQYTITATGSNDVQCGATEGQDE